MSFIQVLFIAEALLLEEAGTCAVIRNANSIYAFVLQYAILKVPPQVKTLQLIDILMQEIMQKIQTCYQSQINILVIPSTEAAVRKCSTK